MDKKDGPLGPHWSTAGVSHVFQPKILIKDVDTVTFFPREIPIPKGGLDDFLRQTATDIITILTAPPSTTTPSLEGGDPTHNDLQKMTERLIEQRYFQIYLYYLQGWKHHQK